MRNHSINEAKEKKLQVFKGNKKRGIFVSTKLFIVPFKRWVIFANMKVILTPLTK